MRWCLAFVLLGWSFAFAGPPSSRELFKQSELLDQEAKDHPEQSKELQQKRCEILKDASFLTVEETKPSYEILIHAAYCFVDLENFVQAELMSRMFLSLVPSTHPFYKTAELLYDFCKTSLFLSSVPREIVIRGPLDVAVVPSSLPLPVSLPPGPLSVALPPGPLVVEDSPAQQRKRRAVLGLSLGGLGGVLVLGGLGAFFLLRDDGVNGQGSFTQ